MTNPSPASPNGARPYNALLLTTFAVLSVAGLWFMRIMPVLNNAPIGFVDVTAAGAHPNGTLIKKNFTGLKYLDEGLSFLVTAFLSGAAGWNEAFYWQQFHFLFQIAPMIAIMNVEACRERNQGSLLKYTAVFTFLYQNIGGAVIIPIWMLLLHRLSGRNMYFQSGRTVPLPYARTILPATLLIYLLPTIAVFMPGKSLDLLQTALAFWQPTPILVNIPLWFAALFVSSTPASSSSSKAKTADTPHLKILYNTLFAASIISHWITIYKVASSETPGVTLARVFLPSPAHWLTSMNMGLMWIFQCDWIVCAILHVVPALVAIYDIQRLVPDIDNDPAGDKVFKGVYVTAALTVLGGPGAALAAVWGWREEQLIVLEERAAEGDMKKGM
jgi:hypothetical protein